MENPLSVIIPSYNSGGQIQACLGALRRQRTDLDFEVLVVDSSDDGNGPALEQLDDIKVIRSPQRLFPGIARNLGAGSAAGTTLCFVDADCVPEPDWIERIWSARPGENRTVVGGPVTNGTPRSLVGTAEYFSELYGFFPNHVGRRVGFLPGANFAIGADEFAEVGGFHDLEAGCDVVFGRACSEAGIQPLFDPSIRVVHSNRTEFRGFLSNQEKLGRGTGFNRALFALPHSWLAQFPALWPLVPAARLVRMCYKVSRYGRGQRWSFMKSLPLAAIGALYFGVGFARGARDGLSPKQCAPE